MTRPGASLSELLLQAGAHTDVSDADAGVYRAAPLEEVLRRKLSVSSC